MMSNGEVIELTIVVSGGLIQDILQKGDQPRINVIIMDYDVEGFDEDEEIFRDPEEQEYHEIEWGSPSIWRGYREEGNGTKEPHGHAAERWQGLQLKERQDIANGWMHPGVIYDDSLEWPQMNSWARMNVVKYFNAREG